MCQTQKILTFDIVTTSGVWVVVKSFVRHWKNHYHYCWLLMSWLLFLTLSGAQEILINLCLLILSYEAKGMVINRYSVVLSYEVKGMLINLCLLILSYGAKGMLINLYFLFFLYVQLLSLSLSFFSTLGHLKYFVLMIFPPYGYPSPSDNIFHFYEMHLCFFLYNSNLSLCLLAHPLPPMLDFFYWCKL